MNRFEVNSTVNLPMVFIHPVPPWMAPTRINESSVTMNFVIASVAAAGPGFEGWVFKLYRVLKCFFLTIKWLIFSMYNAI
jgi:hypothetical protein